MQRSSLRRALVTLTLTLTALTALVLPASAASSAPPAPPTVTVDRVCGSWTQVIPNVWAIICLDRNGGALFQPYAEMRNQSGSAVTMDVFTFLNATPHTQCGTWPSLAPPGYTLTCTNHTWRTAGSPRFAEGQFWVNGVQKVLLSPSLP